MRTRLKFDRRLKGVRRVILPAGATTENTALADPPDNPAIESPSPIELEQQRLAILDRIARALESRTDQLHEAFQEMKGFSIRLAISIARSILTTELQTNDARIRQILDDALHHDDPPQIIRLHPTVLELLQQNQFPGLRTQVQWIADPSLPLGDCEIVTDNKSLIISLETQLQSIEQQLIQELSANEH